MPGQVVALEGGRWHGPAEQPALRDRTPLRLEEVALGWLFGRAVPAAAFERDHLAGHGA